MIADSYCNKEGQVACHCFKEIQVVGIDIDRKLGEE